MSKARPRFACLRKVDGWTSRSSTSHGNRAVPAMESARQDLSAVSRRLVPRRGQQRLRFGGMNAPMTRKRNRPDAFGRRGIYNKDWVMRWQLGDSFATARTEIFHSGGDCL